MAAIFGSLMTRPAILLSSGMGVLLLVLLLGAGALMPPPASSAMPPAVDAVKPVDFVGLHNVVAFHEGFYSGSAPDSPEAFASLADLGVRTVISVDGAVPDIIAARAGGMRYVHLPIGYNGFDETRRAELVRAVRDLPRPIYIHCHHGKHRSAGAAATIAVSLGWLTNDAAIERMKVSGTAAGYTGLWSCAAKAAPMMAAAIDAARADFPEVTKPESMIAAMVAIDEALDRIKLVERNDWKVPADHPDLAPAADAGKLADLLRLATDDAHITALDDLARSDFRALLADGVLKAGALEAMLSSSDGNSMSDAERARLKAALAAVGANCKACHVKHRD